MWNIHFCIRFVNSWKTSMHKLRNELVKNSLKSWWTRVRMLHHRFPNLSKLFYGDLSGEIKKDICSLDYTHEKTCNFSKNIDNEPEVTCAIGGKCSTNFVTYKAMCRETGKYYIRSARITYKKRMEGHFTNVRKLVKFGTISDSFSQYFSIFVKHHPPHFN